MADALFELDVARIERRLQHCGGAEIGTRGHDAGHAGEPRHAHPVSRMWRLAGVADDAEHVSVERSKTGSQSKTSRPATLIRSLRFHGVFRARAGLSSARMPMALTIRPAKRGLVLRKRRSSRSMGPRFVELVHHRTDGEGNRPPFLDAVEQRLAGRYGREDHGHAGREGRPDELDRARPLDVDKRSVNRHDLVSGDDPRQQDRHGLAVLAAAGIDRHERAGADHLPAFSGNANIGVVDGHGRISRLAARDPLSGP